MKTEMQIAARATYNGMTDRYEIPILDLSTTEADILTAAGWEYLSARCESDGRMIAPATWEYVEE